LLSAGRPADVTVGPERRAHRQADQRDRSPL